MRLSDYRISSKLGFLLENPLDVLPPYFDPWNTVSRDVASLIENDSIRAVVDQLPLLATEPLEKDYNALCLAHGQLATIATGYIWTPHQPNIPVKLPRNLAVPFYKISKRIGIPPIFCHAATVLHNWRYEDATKLHFRENLSLLYGKMIPEDDIDGFFLVTNQLEAHFASAIPPIMKAVEVNELSSTMDALRQLISVLNTLMEDLDDLRNYVNPTMFYGKVRPYLAGTNSGPYAKYGGIIFEGVCDQPIALSGGSAAQSSILHTVDAFLGIEHASDTSKFLLEMQQYMPPEHASFIGYVKDNSLTRQFAIQHLDQTLLNLYNDCITTLADFRSRHIKIVTSYIINAKQYLVTEEGERKKSEFLSSEGTGGTSLIPFLKSIRNTTLSHIIPMTRIN